MYAANHTEGTALMSTHLSQQKATIAAAVVILLHPFKNQMEQSEIG
jgi:hypothetical protein